MKTLFTVRSLAKKYRTPEGPVIVFNDVSFEIFHGLTAVVGESGEGKSTLLNILGGLDRPDRGVVSLDGNRIPYENAAAMHRHRRDMVAWVFQENLLIKHETALDNAALPLLLRGVAVSAARQAAAANLEFLGIEPRLFRRRPAQLSMGERQRVAVARAFTAPAPVILADEPTSSLDSRNAEIVMVGLANLARQLERSIVMVTHDLSLASRFADRTMEFGAMGLRESPSGEIPACRCDNHTALIRSSSNVLESIPVSWWRC